MNDNDLIRRSDAIKAVTTSADYIADAVERLEQIPAVKPKRGEWIVSEENEDTTIRLMKCSECGGGDHTNHIDMKFCYDCGADMRGEDNEGV